MDFARSPGPAINGPPAKADPTAEPSEEPELPTIPPVLPGAPDRSRPASPSPFTVEPPGLNLPGPALAAELHWILPRRPKAKQ